MDDSGVALQGDDEDIEGRGHQQSPQRHGIEPETAHDVVYHAVQVRIRVDVRLSDNQHGRQNVYEALIKHEHVDVLGPHRTEVQDDDDDEYVADDADRTDAVVGDGNNAIRVSQVLTQRTVASL